MACEVVHTTTGGGLGRLLADSRPAKSSATERKLAGIVTQIARRLSCIAGSQLSLWWNPQGWKEVENERAWTGRGNERNGTGEEQVQTEREKELS